MPTLAFRCQGSEPYPGVVVIEFRTNQRDAMTLDPQARVYLDKLESLQLPGFHTMPLEEARKLFRAMRALGAKPDPVGTVEDLLLSGSIPARLYRPLESGQAKLPVVVYFHGGGWVLGDLSTVDNLCRRLSNASGCAFLSVDYRLSPEFKFPEPLDDCYMATQQIVREATTFGLDPDRIAVGGDSAGGGLAAGVALKARERGDLVLSYQLLIYPITAFSFETPLLSRKRRRIRPEPGDDDVVLESVSRSS